SPADPVILSGTINENSQFVDNSGRSFELADTEQGMEVKSLVGRRVEIRGTVMEEMGERIVEVNDYKLLE
ncbi:MAG TPA: hypothetical protein VLT88_06380, partial [Desulfosarcina sp.]|nr:hypothetical protein [Desulfosarcina sp.]